MTGSNQFGWHKWMLNYIYAVNTIECDRTGILSGPEE